MKSCKEVSELVSQSIDRRLEPVQWMQLRMHLLICDACSSFKRQVEFLHAAARDYARRGMSAAHQWSLSQAARERIRAKLQRER